MGFSLLGWCFAGAAVGAEFTRYGGCCDASAAAPVNGSLFASASDEDNVLRLHRPGVGGAPVHSLDVSRFLGTARKEEADLEGAARLGNRIFWIGSHSRGDDGQPRPARQILFATVIRGEGEAARLEPDGVPFAGLVAALVAEPQLAALKFAQAAGLAGEDRGGLNIEGLAATAGGSLLMGFRSPVPGGRALIVPLVNPEEVIAGRAPRLGAPITLDLGGLGVRDLTRVGDRFVILAGPASGGGKHRLFLWEGGNSAAVEIRKALPAEFRAEAIVPGEAAGATGAAVEILADDDAAKLGGKKCRELDDRMRRSFRGLRVVLPAVPAK